VLTIDPVKDLGSLGFVPHHVKGWGIATERIKVSDKWWLDANATGYPRCVGRGCQNLPALAFARLAGSLRGRPDMIRTAGRGYVFQTKGSNNGKA
jgi:hypothetical protein